MSILFTILIFVILSEYFITKDLTLGYKNKLYDLIPSKAGGKSLNDIMKSSTEPPKSNRKKRNYGNRNKAVNPTTKEYSEYINSMFGETKKGIIDDSDVKIKVTDEQRKKIDDILKGL
jgi:hypothetical protein